MSGNVRLYTNTRTSANINDDDLFDVQIMEVGATQYQPAKMSASELKNFINGGWLIYRALISQSGTSAPTVTILENTLGGSITWAYSTTGRYFGTLVGAFLANTTFFSITLEDGFGNAGVYRNDDDSIGVKTTNTSFTSANGILYNTCLEIRVKI